MPKRFELNWKTKTEEGEVRFLRVTRMGHGQTSSWRFQEKLKSAENWTYDIIPSREDLEELVAQLERYYVRSRVRPEDVDLAKRMLALHKAENP